MTAGRTRAEQIRRVLREGPATVLEIAVELFDGDPTREQVRLIHAHVASLGRTGMARKVRKIQSWVTVSDSAAAKNVECWLWELGREPTRDYQPRQAKQNGTGDQAGGDKTP